MPQGTEVAFAFVLHCTVAKSGQHLLGVDSVFGINVGGTT
jgi:hypothetical protein